MNRTYSGIALKNRGNWLNNGMARHIKQLYSNVPIRPIFMFDLVQVLSLRPYALVHIICNEYEFMSVIDII